MSKSVLPRVKFLKGLGDTMVLESCDIYDGNGNKIGHTTNYEQAEYYADMYGGYVVEIDEAFGTGHIIYRSKAYKSNHGYGKSFGNIKSKVQNTRSSVKSIYAEGTPIRRAYKGVKKVKKKMDSTLAKTFGELMSRTRRR